MKLKHIILLLLGIGFLWLIFYRISENNKSKGDAGKGKPTEKGSANARAIAIEGIVAKKKPFKNLLEISGAITASESITLHSEVSGLVTQINFKEGTQVSKGAVLVRINDKDIQAQLLQAKTRQELAETTENRAKQLLNKGAISQEEYDSALADLNSTKAQTALVRAQLAKTLIVAPFSGKVGLRNISIGEYLTPATSIASLVNINPAKITFSIPERYSNQVKVGAEIEFFTDASPKAHTGKVYAIEPSITTSTRTLEIRALAPNHQGELLPGSFARIKLNLSTINDAITIPTEAIIPVLDGKMVYVSANGKAKSVMIETGTRTDKEIMVLSGINAGDTVLTTGAMALKNDAPVKVKVVNPK